MKKQQLRKLIREMIEDEVGKEELHRILDQAVDHVEGEIGDTISIDRKNKFDQIVKITKDKIDRGEIKTSQELANSWNQAFRDSF